jgi:hypothetical protein|tara:strand:- start:425 stop:1087 length:663 start_codon:yes stop_codon:yes gene_type:complete
MRKAGELIAELLKERTLANNRANPIGSGAYGVVYNSNIPGNVIKQSYPNSFENNFVEEANLQSIAADLGIAPKVAAIETFPGDVGNRFEMRDVRTNYEPVQSDSKNLFPSDRKINIQTAQQLGHLALKGVRLEDRKADNMVQNKMTGRPMQLDFGIADKVEGSEQVATLAMATAEGFEAAGLDDIASIYRATVMDLLEGGDVAEAMDVAKQGFSRLQKIK